MIDLYYAPDNASIIVRIILEELKIPYRAILVDRSRRDQNAESYLALNPNGLIPVCIIDGQPVFETAAIALTLVERAQLGTNAGDLLTPGNDSNIRPQFLKWLFYVSNTLHPDLRLLFYPTKYSGDEVGQLQGFSELTRARLRRTLSIIDAEYSRVAHQYLFGNQPSIVDVYIAACVRWVQLYPTDSSDKFDIAEFPDLREMVVALEARPLVKQACEAEGITGRFFSAPQYANPAEGTAV